MVCLFISHYNEKNKARADELHECLMNNLKSGLFDAVYIIAEDDGKGLEYLRSVQPYTVNILPCTVRPTFRTFFEAINTIDDLTKKAQHDNFANVRFASNEENVYVVSNADIYFKEVPILPRRNQVFCLTRYEVKKNGPIQFLGRSDSQDSYWFRGPIKMPKYADFPNWPGCDNRIIWELNNVGYEMLNPSLTIKSYHLHEGEKSYTSLHRVNRPYMFLTPIELNQ